MKSITAIIVTHNRKTLLTRCLDAVARQTCRPSSILIVDNASTDGTREQLGSEGWLARNDFELLSLETNTGGAGGFHHGIKHAYANGADWIWVMDDDCIPEPDCLEKLLAAMEHVHKGEREDIGFLASRVLWTDGSPCLMNLPVLHPLWFEPHSSTSNLARLSSSSFVSMLVSRKAVEKVGLPVKEFFIWFDDAEYSLRISEQMLCFMVSNSVTIHATDRNIAALDFTQLTDASLWKFSHGIRNQASYMFEKKGTAAGLLFCLQMITRANRNIPVYWHRFSVAKACWDGFRFRYTRYIEKI